MSLRLKLIEALEADERLVASKAKRYIEELMNRLKNRTVSIE